MAIQPDGKMVAAGTASRNLGDNAFALIRYNTDGTLDNSFSADGKLTTDFDGTDNDWVTSVAVQADGKIVAAGFSYNVDNESSVLALARYNTDGTLDTSFGTDGKLTTGSSYAAYSIAIQTDGKIVAAGYSFNIGNFDFALERYNTNGDLDTSFSADGKLTTDFGSDDYGISAAIQTDGKIVVAGYSLNGTSADFALARYNTDGTLDNSFSTDGILTTAIDMISNAFSVAIQPDGKIVVAGTSYNGTDNDFALARYNTDGTLDNSFSTDGMLSAAIGMGNDFANSVVIQPDEKIVVAGNSFNGTDDDFILARYNSDGTLDTGFSADGILATDFDSGTDIAASVVIQSDGKIAVAGYSFGVTDEDFALARYDTDGTLDNGFGTVGKVTTGIGSGNDHVNSIAIQPDAKIVAAGYSFQGADNDFSLARYKADGTPDNSFGTGGKLTTHIGAGNDYANSVALQTDGKIVVAGYSDYGSYSRFALARYNTDGTLDNNFSTDGMVATAIGSSFDIATSVAIQPDGKIVAAGYSHNGINYHFALARYNTDGTLDNSFSADGKLTTVIGILSYAYSVAIQPDGKIIAAGSSFDGTDGGFTLARYNADGSLDNSFSTDGILTTIIGLGAGALSLAIQPDGKIVAAGKSYNNSYYDFALTRYNTDGTLDNSFSTDGILTTAIDANEDVAYSVAIQPDGKIVAAGSSYVGPDYNFALTRYNTDGTLDISFSTDGMLTTAIGSGHDEARSMAIQPDGNIIVAGYSYNGLDDDFALVRYHSGFPSEVNDVSSGNNSLLIFPNPSSDKITLSFSPNEKSGIQITNTLGQIVFAEKINAGKEEIDVSRFPAGIYLITIETSSEKFEGKFLKQ